MNYMQLSGLDMPDLHGPLDQQLNFNSKPLTYEISYHERE